LLSLVLVSPACSAALEVDSCEHEGVCEETGLLQLQRRSSHPPSSGGQCCWIGCDKAPQGCNSVFNPHDSGTYCSTDLATCEGSRCGGEYCAPSNGPTSLLEEKADETPETGGVCCFNPGCQGCNDEHNYCSQSKERCDECVAQSANKNGGYCPAPSQPTPSPTPNVTSGVCCFNPGCQGCNDEHNYCSQSKERCDECVAQSANKNGGFCDAPSSLLEEESAVQKQQDTRDDYLSPCADQKKTCDQYKARGYCDTTDQGWGTIAYMYRNCKKTCGRCPGR